MMNYETAKGKVLDALYKKSNTIQAELAKIYLERTYNIVIFPMNDLDLFCEEHFMGNESEMEKRMEEGTGFDDSDTWCLWNEKEKTLSSADELLDLVDNKDKLFEFIMEDREVFALLFYVLDFSETQSEEIIKVYKGV